MKQRAERSFREQRALYVLRFTCEHCTNFAVHDESCSHGYPNEAHREAHYADEVDVELTFCKDFELR